MRNLIHLSAIVLASMLAPGEPPRDPLQGWKIGPLPANTVNYGAVVLREKDGKPITTMHFASFKGDHAILVDGRKVIAADVALYNNSIVFPFVDYVGISGRVSD